MHGGADFGVFPVQVGLLRREQVEIIFVRYFVVLPRRTFYMLVPHWYQGIWAGHTSKIRPPVIRRLADAVCIVLGLLPYVPVSKLTVSGGSRALKPLVLVNS